MSERGEQGRQGPTGTQGQQGVQGIQGVIGEGTQGRQGERGAPGKPWRSKQVTISFFAVVLVAIAVTGLQGFTIEQNRKTIRRLQEAEKTQAADRAATRARFVQADVSLCVEIEALKARARQEAKETFSNLDRNLALLHLAKTQEIIDVATERRDTVLRRFRARKGGCHSIPSATQSKP